MVKIDYLIRNNKKTFITLALTTIGVIVFAFLIKGQAGRLQDERHTLMVLRQDYANLQQIYSDNVKYGEELHKVLGSTPSSYDEVREYAGKIETLARSNNLSSLELRFDDTAKAESGGGKSLKIGVEVAGYYPNLSNFLDRLVNLPYNTTFETIRFAKDEGGLVKLTLIYKIYVND